MLAFVVQRLLAHLNAGCLTHVPFLVTTEFIFFCELHSNLIFDFIMLSVVGSWRSRQVTLLFGFFFSTATHKVEFDFLSFLVVGFAVGERGIFGANGSLHGWITFHGIEHLFDRSPPMVSSRAHWIWITWTILPVRWLMRELLLFS